MIRIPVDQGYLNVGFLSKAVVQFLQGGYTAISAAEYYYLLLGHTISFYPFNPSFFTKNLLQAHYPRKGY
jgi:hypothetical protein